jgi:prepilin-type N-terminal cleavage/methylation domain-containing protein
MQKTPAKRPGSRKRRRPASLAFSLVELVIVVVIIGIIAAIAVPRISRGTAGAGESALRASLKGLRDAIDRYAAEHKGELPGAKDDGLGNAAKSEEAFVNQLTKYSNLEGGVSVTPAATHPFGPYLQRIPPLPVGSNNGKNGIGIDATNSPPLVIVGPEGWVYNPDTGEIIANSDDTNFDGSLTFDEF